MQTEVEQLRAQVGTVPEFAQTLIDEKNAELDDLGREIEQLRKELLESRMGGLERDLLERLVGLLLHTITGTPR